MEYKVFKIEWHKPFYPEKKIKYFDSLEMVISYLSDDRGFESDFREVAVNLWQNFEESEFDSYNWDNFHEFKGLYGGLTFEVFLCGLDSIDDLIAIESQEWTEYTHDSLYADLNNVNYGWDEGYISNDLAKSMTKYYCQLFARLN